jgi:hypothetical protein
LKGGKKQVNINFDILSFPTPIANLLFVMPDLSIRIRRNPASIDPVSPLDSRVRGNDNALPVMPDLIRHPSALPLAWIPAFGCAKIVPLSFGVIPDPDRESRITAIRRIDHSNLDCVFR